MGLFDKLKSICPLLYQLHGLKDLITNIINNNREQYAGTTSDITIDKRMQHIKNLYDNKLNSLDNQTKM